jgi:hypothetical protein
VTLYRLFAADISVSAPIQNFPDRSFSLTFELKNESLFPAYNVEYKCGLDNFETRKTRIARLWFDPSDLYPPRPRLGGNEPMTARCETMFNAETQVKRARYVLRLSYRTVWGTHRESLHWFVATIDARTGQIGKWVPE